MGTGRFDGMRTRIGGLSLGFMLAASLGLWPLTTAHADEGSTGSGTTSLKLHLLNTGEYGGIDAQGENANPDEDGDGLGDNLAFTVPTMIDFAVASDGTLTGPSAGEALIRNHSAYPIRVSSVHVLEADGWNIVDRDAVPTQDDAVRLGFGPSSPILDASDYLTKAPVVQPNSWNMAAKGAQGDADRLSLSFEGTVSNVTKDISTATGFGSIRWYVTPGNVA